MNAEDDLIGPETSMTLSPGQPHAKPPYSTSEHVDQHGIGPEHGQGGGIEVVPELGEAGPADVEDGEVDTTYDRGMVGFLRSAIEDGGFASEKNGSDQQNGAVFAVVKGRGTTGDASRRKFCARNIPRTQTSRNGRVDGALLCMKLRNEKKFGSLPSLTVAKELARCMHEPKFHTLRNTIDKLGLDKTVQLFHETSQIQEAGGIVSAEGKKKAPGGVFFALLKKTASNEQLSTIFEKEKELNRMRRKRHNVRRKLKRCMKSELNPDLGSHSPLARQQEPVAMSRDLGRGVCSEQGVGATWEMDGEVTSMEVDEREMEGLEEEGDIETLDSVILEGKGDASDSVRKGGSVILEEEEALILEREHRAVRDFEVTSDVDLVSFILPD